MKAGLDNWIDVVILVIYFILVLLVGLFPVCRKKSNSVKGYFLADRSMLWFPIGASLFASNIGSEHFIGLAGSGAASGIAVAAFEWGAALCLPLLGWVFLPIYLSSGIFTIPEYLSKRFGGTRLRTYLSFLALFLYIVTKISVDVYAGSIFIQQAIGWNTYLSIIILLGVTAIYTVIGGLTAVIFTDTLQTIIMLTGAVTLSILGFIEIGGIYSLISKYMDAIPHSLRYLHELNGTRNNSLLNFTNHCGYPRPDSFHIIRDPINSDLPWPGLLIRSTFISTWYWCADQVIVQRTLAAKDIGHARGATLFAGYLKFLPLFIIILPGMISRVLYTEDVACADAETCMRVCENPIGCSNVAYPKLILGLAPTGIRGLMMAVMMSALMSSLTSIFNSAATLFTMDIWAQMRKHATERELLAIGKIFVVIMVGISIAWIPLIQTSQQGQLFLYIQAITGYLAPPICSVFLLAVFVPMINEKGAFWGMLVGQIAGITRMILDFIYPSPKCGTEDTRPSIVRKVHFTYFSAGLLIFTAILVILISVLNHKPNNQGEYLTFWSNPSIKSNKTETINQVRMNRKAKDFHQTSMQQQISTRQSVQGRWSLNEKPVNQNINFEMQENQENGSDTETFQKKYNDHSESRLDNKDENKKYVNVQQDTEVDGDKRLNTIGNRPNDEDAVNVRLESTNSNYTNDVKSTSAENEIEIEETRIEGIDNKQFDDEKIRKPLTKNNSKVWKRGVEKQPAWQKFVLEFTKKLSEVDEGSKKTEDTILSGKDILKSYGQKGKNLNVGKEVDGGGYNTITPREEDTKSNQRVKKQNINQDGRTYVHNNHSDAITLDNIIMQTGLKGSRYSGKISLDIFKATTPKVIEMDEINDTTRQKLYMGRLIKWFLDINAIILICLFVFLYVLFH